MEFQRLFLFLLRAANISARVYITRDATTMNRIACIHVTSYVSAADAVTCIDIAFDITINCARAAAVNVANYMAANFDIARALDVFNIAMDNNVDACGNTTFYGLTVNDNGVVANSDIATRTVDSLTIDSDAIKHINTSFHF